MSEVGLTDSYFNSPLAFAYLTQKNSPQFLNYLNYWFKLQKFNDLQQQQYQKWLLATPPIVEHQRWNVIDDVFIKWVK